MALGLFLAHMGCATSSPDYSAILRDSALSNLNPAPASMSPPEIRKGDGATIDPLFMRSQADYHYTLGEALSLEGKGRLAAESFRLALIYDQKSPVIRLRLASELLRQGLLTEAIEQAELAAEMDPDYLEARLLLGGLYASMRTFDLALAQYDEIIERRPQHWEAHIFKGLILAEQGQHSQALQHFESLARNRDYPEPFLAHHYIGRVHLEKNRQLARENRPSTGETQRRPAAATPRSEEATGPLPLSQTREAERSLRKALQLKPDHLDSVLALSEIYQRSDRVDESLQLLESYQKRFGPERVVASLLSQSYLEREDYERALVQLQHLERLDQNNLNVRMQIGLLLLERKDYHGAVERFELILQEIPESDRIRFYLAAVYEQLEKWDLARTHYSKISSSSEYFSEAVIHQAYILRNSGRLSMAVSVVDQALQRRSDLPELYAFFASLLEEQKNYSRALKALEAAVVRFPEQAQLYFFLGSIQERLGKKQDSMASMRQVLELEPDHAQALNYLAYTMAELSKNLEEAEVLARRALALQPKDGYILDTVGWVLFKQGRVAEAIPYLEKAFRKQGDESVIAEHLGDAYYRQQLVEKAQQMYRRALEIEQDAKNKTRIQSKLANIDKQQSEAASAAQFVAPQPRAPASLPESSVDAHSERLPDQAP